MHKKSTLAVFLGTCFLATPAMAQSSGDIIPNSYICVFNKAVNKGATVAEARRAVNANGGQVTHTYSSSIHGFAAHMSAQAVAQMQGRNPSIKYCEPDRVITLGPVRVTKGKPGSGGGTAPAQETPWGVTRVNGGISGSYKKAWIIDSGIDGSHPDLNVDDADSVNFVPRESSWDDLNGHGTHVAGTIAALDNSIGVIGIAPGAPVVAVRVLDRRGSGAYSTVIEGVDYVASHGSPGDVANMSLGGPLDTALNEAVVAAAATGVRFTLAAGNSADDAANYSPASANGSNIYTVSAFGEGDVWAYFSNYGSPVDYAEPGVSIYSTYKGDGYATLSGTSMAAPHLAGILLLGGVKTDGTVSGDPSPPADPIGVH